MKLNGEEKQIFFPYHQIFQERNLGGRQQAVVVEKVFPPLPPLSQQRALPADNTDHVY